MVTGIAVLGVLAGSLSSLFNLETPSEHEHPGDSATVEFAVPGAIHAELATLQAQLQTVEQRLGEPAESTRTDPGKPG